MVSLPPVTWNSRTLFAPSKLTVWPLASMSAVRPDGTWMAEANETAGEEQSTP